MAGLEVGRVHSLAAKAQSQSSKKSEDLVIDKFVERNITGYDCKQAESLLPVSKRENYRQMLVGVRMSSARDCE